MKLRDLLYRIEGELPDGQSLLDCEIPVVFVTPSGATYAPEQAACDGELLVVNVRRAIL